MQTDLEHDDGRNSALANLFAEKGRLTKELTWQRNIYVVLQDMWQQDRIATDRVTILVALITLGFVGVSAISHELSFYFLVVLALIQLLVVARRSSLWPFRVSHCSCDEKISEITATAEQLDNSNTV